MDRLCLNRYPVEHRLLERASVRVSTLGDTQNDISLSIEMVHLERCSKGYQLDHQCSSGLLELMPDINEDPRRRFDFDFASFRSISIQGANLRAGCDKPEGLRRSLSKCPPDASIRTAAQPRRRLVGRTNAQGRRAESESAV